MSELSTLYHLRTDTDTDTDTGTDTDTDKDTDRDTDRDTDLDIDAHEHYYYVHYKYNEPAYLIQRTCVLAHARARKHARACASTHPPTNTHTSIDLQKKNTSVGKSIS